MWSNDSKTFLILRRYPYYDYKATTNFKINYKIMSLNETVKTPSGVFNDCIMIKGEGQTNFIGDSEIGKFVNIGAGTITCNYDGIKKHKTKIKDKVFVGSNSSLVAPLTIGERSVIGAGSVITKNVSKKSLSLSRSLQTELKNYKKK